MDGDAEAVFEACFQGTLISHILIPSKKNPNFERKTPCLCVLLSWGTLKTFSNPEC